MNAGRVVIAGWMGAYKSVSAKHVCTVRRSGRAP